MLKPLFNYLKQQKLSVKQVQSGSDNVCRKNFYAQFYKNDCQLADKRTR